jgi:hypothetical protein
MLPAVSRLHTRNVFSLGAVGNTATVAVWSAGEAAIVRPPSVGGVVYGVSAHT